MVSDAPVRFTVYSDVLCPWCYNLAVCLGRVEDEVGDALYVEWRSYLLRPEREIISIEAFRRYTQSWMKPAQQNDSGRFSIWATAERPPAYSVPPAVALKAARNQAAYRRYQLAVMDAYFHDNRDVTQDAVLVDLAEGLALDTAQFRLDLDDPLLEQAVLRDHKTALERGITGIPTVVVDDEIPIPGSQDRAFYLNIVTKSLANRKAV